MPSTIDHRGAEPAVAVAPSPPRDESELLTRARAIAGREISTLAHRIGVSVPCDLRRAKGWVGELIERSLGASAGSKPGPDFPALGIELKTIPVDASGRPRESTHVCAITLAEASGAHWATSRLRAKLARVLWVPVLADQSLPLGDRRVGQPVLWSPDEATNGQLRQDWEEHMERIALGQAAAIRGEHGIILQVRPKAASGRSRTEAPDADGRITPTLPLGFYLRARFTASILANAYAPSAAPWR